MTSAVEVAPLDQEVVHARGVFYMMHGDWELAVADFDRALELDPLYAHVFYNRGLARFNMGDTDGSVADFSRGMELDSAIADDSSIKM